MIPAISAQMMNGVVGSTVPDWLPSGATAFLDFVAGNYYAGGASGNVGDLLGGGFDPSDISAAGMYVAYAPASTNRPNAIGALFADLAAGLAAGCSVVFDINFGFDAYGRLIDFLDAASENVATDYVVGKFSSTKTTIEDQTDIWFDNGSGLSAGVHKIALTFARHDGADYEFAISTDGGAATTAVVAYAPFTPVSTITIGHDGDDSFVLDNSHIRTITLYPAVTPTELAALSA